MAKLNPHAPLSSRSTWLVLLAALFVPSFSAAQTAPAPSADSSSEEPLTLSTFEVVSPRDYGYRATNSIAATGIGTEIYRTPISVSVVTGDLIRDLGAGNFVQSLSYTSSAQTDTRNPGALYVRGFPVPVLVNRYTVASSRADNAAPFPDMTFAERFEIAKGPNAVFFGRVSPSGVINMITLRPQSRDSARLAFTYGSYNYTRGVLDVNKTLGENAAVRLAVNRLTRDDWIDDLDQDTISLYGATTWSITPQLKMNLTASRNDTEETPYFALPRGHPGYTEYTRQNPNEDITIGEWSARFLPANAPFVTYLPDPYESFFNGPRGNSNGPDARRDTLHEYIQPEFVYEPADWATLRFGASFVEDDIVQINSSGFPTFNGTIYRQRPTFDGRATRRAAYEGEAVLNFNLGPTSHYLLLGGRQIYERNGTWSIAGDPLTWNVKTQGPRRLSVAFLRVLPNGFVKPIFPMQRSLERGVYLVDQVGVFEDRVKVLAGIRHTEVTNKASAATGNRDLKSEEDTPSIGVSFEVVKGVSLFANYAETFEPQFSVDAFGNLANNVNGEGTEFGVKFDLFESKISGSLSHYEVMRSGEIRRDFTREAFTGISPIFIPGGDQRSLGYDFDLTYTPTNNYQVVLTYTHIYEAKVLSDRGQPFLVGSRLQNSPEHQFSLWNKYTFTSGPLKGFYIGGGVRQKSNNRVIVNASFDLSNPGYVVYDALVGYNGSWGTRPFTVSLNVNNLFDRYYFPGNFMPGGPRLGYLTMEWKH